MTAFDLVVIAILLCSILISVLRGLLKEILSLLVWVIAFAMSNAYGMQMAQLLPQALPGQLVRIITGFVIVLVGVLLLGALVNAALSALIKSSGFTLADHGLGGLFGLARGIVIVLTIVILAGMTDLPKHPIWRNAVLSPLTEAAVRTIKPWLPHSVTSRISY